MNASAVTIIGFISAITVFATAFPQIRTVAQKYDGTGKSSRIIGGREAIPHSIPYQARLLVSGTTTTWSCSGSIISSYYILTSARCVYGGNEIVVTLGTHNTSATDSGQITSSATNILIHQNYSADDNYYYRYDIALVRTEFEIPFDDHIQPISLPSREDLTDGENFVGRIARASGWGLTDGFNDDSESIALKYVDGKVLKNSKCVQDSPAFRNNAIMCVQLEGGICRGDVGGPLAADYKLVGISSFWFISCLTGYPSGFTRVSSHMDWILENSDVVLV